MRHGAETGAEVRRLLVVGGPGSGKTTLARSVAAVSGLPHHDLDRMAYDPPAGRRDAPFGQWVRVADARRRERAASLAASGAWVADGLYAGWTAPLRDAADVILWLDVPALLAISRVLVRAVGDRRRGGHDWDLRSVRRVALGALGYRRRPVGTADQLRVRDSANSSRTLAVFLEPVAGRMVRCRSAAAVRRAVRDLSPR